LSLAKSQSAPWSRSQGVVSLLDMLEFSAEAYVDIAHQFGTIIGSLGTERLRDHDLNRAFNTLLGDAESLGLLVTRDQIARMILETIKHDPAVASVKEGMLRVRDHSIEPDRLRYHIETVMTVLKSELSVILFRAIPKEKARYCDPKWLTDGILFTKYPDTVDEIQKAGRCFAYGENTACVFHLMRVTDFYLRKVADSLNVPYESRTWQAIGEKITKLMEQKYQTKSDDWKKQEPFYAEILTDIQAIGRGHRNPALHELEKKYDEREAAYLLTVIESFARHVAGRV
jgi:hypothetical protein